MPDTAVPPQADNRQLAEQVYNMIMAEVEPELLLSSIPELDEKYKNESEAEHEARMNRYKQAYEIFDVKLNDFMAGVNEKTRRTKRQTLKQQERQAKAHDADLLQSLESAFS